ncbi:MAG: SAM-dependent DNA methyltransferase, partial [Firmicutes bacterium]|nr:SAM-dependent DNA methyltransferase [Bacillota bacterium]
PLLDEKGKPVLKKGEKQPDSSLRDTENVPLTDDIDSYFAREVLPFATDAWVDKSKTKIGYEIPFTRYFYKYTAPAASSDIMAEIMEIEKELDGALEQLRN